VATPVFLQCFDTVGWVTRLVKPVPDMTYNVFGGSLNLTQPNPRMRLHFCYMSLKYHYFSFMVKYRSDNTVDTVY